jgi:hypothetical protein
MLMPLNETEYASVKKSFYNIYSLFKNEMPRSKSFEDCILKWGEQLGISKKELNENLKENKGLKFVQPNNKLEALEQVYDLVYMVYLDGIVEDLELELAMEYAERLKLNKSIVGDILKAIVTAPHDGIAREKVRNELKEFLDLNP